jgi:hypothetical protein
LSESGDEADLVASFVKLLSESILKPLEDCSKFRRIVHIVTWLYIFLSLKKNLDTPKREDGVGR